MNDDVNAGTPGETDEALRRVYGANAVFSRVGAFTLVHLDEPAPEEKARREMEFDPDDFFFDSCPLCERAKAEGGHIVFDQSEEDPLRSTTYEAPASDGDAPSPAVRFDAALGEVAALARALDEAARERGCGDVLAGVASIAVWHERIVETLWAEESTRRVESFERMLAEALTSLEEIRTRRPELDDRTVPLEQALERVAAVWRAL